MIYEVRATMFFTSEDEASDFLFDCETALPKAIILNACQPDQECSRVELIRCFHDEIPHQPCEAITEKDNCPVCGEPE